MNDASGRNTPTHNHNDTNNEQPIRRRRRVPVALLVALALVGMGLVAERQPTPAPAETASHRSKFFGRSSKASAKSASTGRSGRQRRPQARQNSGAGAIAQAERFAATAERDSRGVARQAQQDDPPPPSASCAALSQIAGRFVARINNLIEAFPFLASRLQAIKNRALDRIEAVADTVECDLPPPSG